MRKVWLCIAAGVAIVGVAGAAQAAGTLMYSFETPAIDGFGPNGGGIYTQDTYGATNGTHSMRVDVPNGQSFVGALTGNLSPVFGDPPGVQSVNFDMSIKAGEEFVGGGFSVIGVTVFGCTQGGSCGNSVQFNGALQHIDGLAAGTYPVSVTLNNSLGFIAGQTFDQIFGASGSGSPLIPTHFQFFINQSTNDGNESIVYIDNVRAVAPEPASLTIAGLGLVGLVMFARRRIK